MAFSKQLVLRKEIAKGVVLEQYKWYGASVTTGAVAPDTTDTQNYGEIVHILGYCVTDNDTAGGCSVEYNNDLAPSSLTLTFTSNDTGSVTLWGLVA